MKKTGLILAAAAASLLVVGCATQADNSAQPQPAPVAAQPMNPDVAPHYKGSNSCKAQATKKHHHHHHAAQKAATTDASGNATDSSSSASAPSSSSSSSDATSSSAQ